MRRGTRKEQKKEEDEVEQMLRAAQDEILLNLSINSHLSRPSPSSSSTISNLDPDSDLDLERRFQALKTKSKEQQPLDISARFDALKNKSNNSGNAAAVTFSASEKYEESDEEDEEVQIQKLLR
ncbi:hypothetical protein TSUD_358800 [Trifolium subterraneum]|uniref:Uncharacterized protein n=1 Tax=Trifolium subterraneum TaxID=3900 RepID=A0A2Z6MTB1_TRISU|nr:hypothetical protein TSUD_358800 [Trifolium subterraneum]